MMPSKILCAVLFCFTILAVAFFGGIAAGAEKCETPAAFIADFEVRHAEFGDVSVAFNGLDTGTIPGEFTYSDPQRYEWVVQMRITYRDDDGMPRALSLWTVYYVMRGEELCSIEYTTQYFPL